MRYPGVNALIKEALGDPPAIGVLSDLAKKVGVTASTVSRWNSGGASPDPGQWPAIEDALGMTPGTLKAASLTPTAQRYESDQWATQAEVDALRLTVMEDMAEAREQLAQLTEDADRLRNRVAAIERGLGGSEGQRSQSDE